MSSDVTRWKMLDRIRITNAWMSDDCKLKICGHVNLVYHVITWYRVDAKFVYTVHMDVFLINENDSAADKDASASPCLGLVWHSFA